MLTGFVVGAIAGGLMVWKYRDSLQEYVKGSAGPARDKVDGRLRSVQETSETFLVGLLPDFLGVGAAVVHVMAELVQD